MLRHSSWLATFLPSAWLKAITCRGPAVHVNCLPTNRDLIEHGGLQVARHIRLVAGDLIDFSANWHSVGQKHSDRASNPK